VKPDGRLVYSVCSLLKREGEDQAVKFAARHQDFDLVPMTAEEVGGEKHFATPGGSLRTLPFMKIGNSTGLDGFFAVSFRRR
jgi:16S rRNA (cytosine967-C5)-methyltransferase